jgi:NTE family protein
MPKKMGLVLSGGGARGAYQVGVLSAIFEISQNSGLPAKFNYLSGVSAGAINACALAAKCENFKEASENLNQLWGSITADQVFSTDSLTMGKIGLRWMSELSFGSFTGTTPGRSLLDTSPLRVLIENNIDFSNVDENIAKGHLSALVITALNYANSATVSFIQGRGPLAYWDKGRKRSETTKITSNHILASSAIPLLFPPVHVEGRFFGDGAVRNHAPCSPVIYLGAEKLMVIGVRRQAPTAHERRGLSDASAPSVARVVNTLLNGALLDAVEQDIERLHRLNDYARMLTLEQSQAIKLRPLDYLFISPSEDIGEMAVKLAHNLPRVVRYLINGLGSLEDASELISYLLFDSQFCTNLIEIGYKDGLARKEEIIDFLEK